MMKIRTNTRHGMTLVELLVVLGIVSLLAALVLPTVKGLMTDRKTSQSAIVVKNYIEAARARAIGKNRSVAVVLQRVSSRAIFDSATSSYVSGSASRFAAGSRASFSPDTNFIPYNTCIKLSLAEEPLPVTERTLPMGATIIARSPSDGLTPSIPTNYDPLVPLLDMDQGNGIAEVRVFRVTTTANAADLLGEYLVAGNEISLGDSPLRFTIASPTSRKPHDNFASGNPNEIWFSVYNEVGLDGSAETAMRPYVNLTAGGAVSSFRIYQKPKPIYSQALQLPKGTCIDLSLSGFANDRPGLTDYRVRFSSDWVISGTDGIPTPEELRPIYLVFSPDGSFSRIYANEKSVPPAVNPQAVRIDPVEDVFLHIGRIDQVYMPVDTSVGGRNRTALEVAVANGVKQNLTDPSSYVLRISAKSGAITAAPIRQYFPLAGDTLGDIIGKSRLGTYNSTITGQ
jgi:prepilin-type N-terminal cleavage/methylation domain-containing protein